MLIDIQTTVCMNIVQTEAFQSSYTFRYAPKIVYFRNNPMFHTISISLPLALNGQESCHKVRYCSSLDENKYPVISFRPNMLPILHAIKTIKSIYLLIISDMSSSVSSFMLLRFKRIFVGRILQGRASFV